MKRLRDYLFISDDGYKNLKKAIFACTITNMALFLPFIITTLFFGELIRGFIGIGLDWNKMWIIWGFGMISALLVFLSARNDYEKTYISSYKESKRTRFKIAEHLISLPMSFFNEKDLSDLTSNMMSDCSALESMLSSTIPPLIANFISVFLTCIILAFFEWRLAVLIFITIPISFIIVMMSKKNQKKIFEEHRDSKLELYSKIQEYLDGIKVIKSYGLGGKEFKKLDEALIYMKKMSIKVELIVGVFMSSASIILQAGIGITIYFGTKLLLKGEIDLLTLLIFLLISTRIYGPFLAILSQLYNLLNLDVVTERMNQLLSAPIMSGDIKEIKDLNIKAEHISFSYNDGYPVIQDISFEINEGKVFAFVGPSGSGKSTLMKLIARFWDTDDGEIYLGDKNIKELEQSEIMKNMSIVFQDIILFNDTIFNNIKIGNSEASREDIIRAAKLAQCEEFINRLPNKYETLLGENGSTLSGGERQRISIARSILKDAPIILLDEATSSLDPENEVLVQRAISELTKNKRVIVIAHKLNTIEEADKILVLNHGRIVEEGRHDELMERNGLYRKMYSLQRESMNYNITSID
ncbi:MAG: ABC transporter ATP-binding protein [Tissierellia bacterium]|nr:ABC transporter ATP-binding protein [Tissierellia bacterium]